jgi:DNA repair exonuclease SbcCD ATPase subunit
MSNQNDLDDQLYILLASMKEYREAIKDDNKRLEAFYNQVASGVLDRAEKSLQETNKQAIGALKNRIQELDKATNRLNWQFIAIYSCAFVALVMIFFLGVFLYVPSLDEIQQRRADIAELNKYPIQIRRNDDETLVRIMTKNCYSFQANNVKDKTYDWCKIDPKKY